MRKLNEAVVSPDVKQIIDCITLKDWQRAYNTKQSLLPSMMNKITDPKKKVGRAAAQSRFHYMLRLRRKLSSRWFFTEGCFESSYKQTKLTLI